MRVGARRDQPVIAAFAVRVDDGRQPDRHRLQTPGADFRETAAAAFGIDDFDIQSMRFEQARPLRHPQRQHIHCRRCDTDTERGRPPLREPHGGSANKMAANSANRMSLRPANRLLCTFKRCVGGAT